MTLRMVFDRDDLQRIRVAETPDPLWELVLGSHRLRDHRPSSLRRRIQLNARQDERSARALKTLFTLVPPKGNFPDFLTPACLPGSLESGFEAVACTSRARLRADLRTVFTGAAPHWVKRLADGDRDEVHRVVGALRDAYDLVIAPIWHSVRETVAADRAERVRILAGSGAGALVSGIPGVRGWDGEVLEIAYPAERTVRLGGRGLTLIPSRFCADRPVTFIDPELPPVLLYPAGRTLARQGATTPELVALLGRTRAESLGALRVPRTTSKLASCLGTSIGTASKQAAVLREAGLVTSVRQGGAILHHLTQLGMALLAAEIHEGIRP
ncbi:ArsR/SmtB family transcription factor [Amycolatopsis umgeniensis]|uniref:DNA-binding transcriptional ArsR family regulator n=1 Tax=Amycolatopsis umgeniensis TaxID=336628 RepID=A0A841B421_9PSEU|nr:helix-turn-helix transcriptional regulator [Amycolatopsis umgeniensis]MBB5853610.1 DNA-binding transcriptional ArsR family regulator [Amycolatopsis umgeniensis]